MRGKLRLATLGALAGWLISIPWNGCHAAPAAHTDAEVHAFYYGWYANPDTDGHWSHWDHSVMLRGGGSGAAHTPPDDIGATFYPAAGLYSSNSPDAAARHMRELKRAGVGVAALSWWGVRQTPDKQVGMILDAAAKEGLRVCFHIEPFPGRSAATMGEAVAHIVGTWGGHIAFYRHNGKPFFYVYDSYLLPAEEWAALLKPDGANTIRNTANDSLMIGLWVKEGDGKALVQGGFDGFYTYFATDGFTYGSTSAHWPEMARFARANDMLFIPSVGPGYDDTRIRPWNGENTRARGRGAYYDRMFAAALEAAPDMISITSYNEWHEGTQVEPAAPKSAANSVYPDYEGLEPYWYLDRTRHWVDKWTGK
jgi:glycoprotein endo-alpha-1,2-mannosidase